ncbi:hypothetical protein ACN38_g13248, partial [Penicillium nordicum]
MGRTESEYRDSERSVYIHNFIKTFCQSARLHTWIYMVLYHGDHVTSSTGYTI